MRVLKLFRLDAIPELLVAPPPMCGAGGCEEAVALLPSKDSSRDGYPRRCLPKY